ncbi:MAG: hypothetical protein ACPGYT_11775 [Nitrospirales bacterium]
MNGERLMYFLVCFYAVTSLVFLFEGNDTKATYWLGALIITSSVLWMK